MPVGISYPQYSRYEAGDQLPNLEQAIELCKQLDAPTLEGVLEWNLAQISDEKIRDEVLALLKLQRRSPEGLASQPPASLSQGGHGTGGVPLDDVIVFNRSHLELFLSDPAYRDVFTCINSFAPEWIAPEEIAAALGFPVAKIEAMLGDLARLGVVVPGGGRYRASKRNYYFPDDEDFFGLRNQNFTHNVQAILRALTHQDLLGRKAYRGLVTRELTAEQLTHVLGRIDDFMAKVVAMPETNRPDRIYSVCTIVGERFRRGKPPGTEDPA